MESNVIISDKEKLELLKNNMFWGGASKIHIVSDFNRTLTNAYLDGKKMPSIISELRSRDYLGEEYSRKAFSLFDKYHSIELNPNVTDVDKRKAMHTWWVEHFNLLVEYKLNIKDIEKIIESQKVVLRSGVPQLFSKLKEKNIPLIILSSNNLGTDSIRMYFEKEKIMNDNVNIISNEPVWDKDGFAVSIVEPIIHIANKDESVLRDNPIFDKIRDRKNVILLGDSLEDVKMVSGFEYDNLIKIGFYNEETDNNLYNFKQVFDIIILNDAGVEEVNNLLMDILNEIRE